MKIVSINEIPDSTQNVPLKNLPDLYSKAQQMEKICLSNNGVGLAASQVGIPWKFFIYCDDNDIFHYMIDCEYIPQGEDKYVSIEGCLSIKNEDGTMRHFKVMRNSSILVNGKELVVGDKLEIKNFNKKIDKGLECAVFQHEIDHQNNILISSIGEELFIQKVDK
jgi:peptide deformylase